MRKISIIKELRSFLLLWSSQTVSELGTAMTDYALIIWVYQKTGTASGAQKKNSGKERKSSCRG